MVDQASSTSAVDGMAVGVRGRGLLGEAGPEGEPTVAPEDADAAAEPLCRGRTAYAPAPRTRAISAVSAAPPQEGPAPLRVRALEDAHVWL